MDTNEGDKLRITEKDQIQVNGGVLSASPAKRKKDWDGYSYTAEEVKAAVKKSLEGTVEE